MTSAASEPSRADSALVGGPHDAAAAECSRAGCRDAASWRVEWRNPRIHTPDRRKTWVACDAHVGYLREFLAAREFPVAVAPLRAGTPS